MKSVVLVLVVLFAAANAQRWFFEQANLDTFQAAGIRALPADNNNLNTSWASVYYRLNNTDLADLSTYQSPYCSQGCTLWIDLAWHGLSGPPTTFTLMASTLSVDTYTFAATAKNVGVGASRSVAFSKAMYDASLTDTAVSASTGLWAKIATAAKPNGEVAGLLYTGGFSWASAPQYSEDFVFEVGYGTMQPADVCSSGTIGFAAYSATYSNGKPLTQSSPITVNTYWNTQNSDGTYDMLIRSSSSSYDYTGLTGDATAVHVHAGGSANRCSPLSDQAGGVLAVFGAISNTGAADSTTTGPTSGKKKGTFASFVTTTPACAAPTTCYVPITYANLNAFYAGLHYVNIHTAAKPNGEIRGFNAGVTRSGNYAGRSGAVQCGRNDVYGTCPLWLIAETYVGSETNIQYPYNTLTYSGTPEVVDKKNPRVCPGIPQTPWKNTGTTPGAYPQVCGGGPASSASVASASIATLVFALLASFFAL